MLDRSAKGPSPEKFKNLDRYKPGDRVLVNDKGKWRIAELDAEPVPHGSTQLELKIDGGTTLLVSEAPKLLAFQGGEVIDDPNGRLEIGNGLPTKNGDVEYSVIDAGGKVHRGVSEKFLVAWEATLKIEQEVGKMEKQIADLSLQFQKKLGEKIGEVKTKIRDVFNNLPEFEEMGKQTTRDIQRAIEQIDLIHKDAEGRIAELRRNISEAEKDEVEVARKNSLFVHVKTPKEVEQINKEASAAVEKLNKRAKSIADRLQKQIEKKIEDETKTKQDAEDTRYQAKLDAWTNNTSPKKGDKPEPKVATLTDSEKKRIEDQAKKDFVEQITDFSKNPNTELEDALSKLRKEKAKDEPMTGSLDSSGKDYADIPKANKEIFYELLGDWQKPYSPIAYEAPKTKISPEGKAIFDFDNEATELGQELNTLLSDASIPKEGGVPKKEYQALYDDIQDAKKRAEVNFKALETLDSFKAKGGAGLDRPALEAARLACIKNLKQEIHQFHIDIQTLKIKQGAEDKYEKKDRMIAIDLSSALVEKMLLVNLDKSKTAIKAMYHGDATVAFRDIISATMPAGINIDQLREAGIKDWDEFKKIWDKTLAGEVAKNLEAIAKQSVLRKATEALDSLSGAFKKAKANIGQVMARNSLNALLLMAPNIALHVVVGQTAGILNNAAMASAGGTASGAIKWWTANKIFGTEKRVQKTKDALGKVQSDTEVIADSLVDKMVDEFFVDTSVTPANRPGGGTTSGAPAASAKPTSFFGKVGRLFNISKHADRAIDKRVGAQVEKQGRFLEGIPMMSGVIAHTIREITAGEIEVDLPDGTKTKLKGSDRLRFERAVNQLETKDGAEQQIKELALLISQMGRKGDDYQQAMQEQAGGGVTAMDKYLLAYSGKGNLKDSLAMNVGVNTLLSGIFLASGTARAAFGALVGGISGWKMGERRYWKSEQKEAKKVLAGRMDTFYNDVRDFATLSVDKKTKFKSELIYLKKFLHGNAAQEDLTAAMFVTAEGPQVDEMLLRQIENLVYEGEKTGVLLEKEEDAMNLTKVLEAMKMYGTETAQKEEKKGKWFKKFGYKLAHAVVGAGAGAGAFLLGGMLIRPAIKGLRNLFGFGHAGSGMAADAKDGINHEGVVDGQDKLEGSGTLPETHKFSAVEATQNFAADHHLSVEGGEYLKHLTQDYGLSDPDSLQRILDASKVPHGKAFLAFSGNHSRVIFEEIKLHGDPGKAVQFLKDQNFGSSAEAHLGKYFDKNSPTAYEDFVKQYDPTNKQMADALRHALQADDNIALANKFGQPGFRIDAKGDVLYFGLKEDGTPILSGEGKLVVKGITTVDVKTDITEISSPKFDRKLGYMPPDDDSLFEHRVKPPILDKQGNYVSVDHPGDGPLGDGPYFVEKNIPLGGGNEIVGGNETHTQKVVVGDTLATFKASNNEIAHVDGKVATTGGGEEIKSGGVVGKGAEAEPISSAQSAADLETAPKGPHAEALKILQGSPEIKAQFKENVHEIANSFKEDLDNRFAYSPETAKLLGSKIDTYVNKKFDAVFDKYLVESKSGVNSTMISQTEQFLEAVKDFRRGNNEAHIDWDGSFAKNIFGNDKILDLAGSDRPEQMPMLGNDSSALRLWDPELRKDIFFVDKLHTYSVSENGDEAIMKDLQGNDVIGRPVPYEEILKYARGAE